MPGYVELAPQYASQMEFADVRITFVEVTLNLISAGRVM